ncbi:MAG: TrpR YerC/YecD [Eubacterium sp.]|nr:TrpR YerC/YecD [Eubacterium sp.]
MQKTIKTQAVEDLFDAILSLKDKEECYSFFEDIFTTNEILGVAERLEVAKLLYQNKTYMEIAKKTGASTATISRVNRFLSYGNGSCDVIFERLGISKEPGDKE